MSKRPYYVACSLAMVLVFGSLSLPEGPALRLKLFWGSLFVPLFGLATSLQGLAGSATQTVTPRSVLLRQLDQLRRENHQLRAQLLQLEAVQAENQRLHEAVRWESRTPWKLKLARVVAHDPTIWWRTLQVDLGSRDGVRPDLPVLTAQGLVGRVSEVGLTRSQVVLVGDPACRFSAQVRDGREKGIIAPDDGSFDRLVVDFLYVPVASALAPGQSVVTSGEGGVFPKGIPVGQVVDVATNEFGLYLEARVRLAANLNRLEEVWILFP